MLPSKRISLLLAFLLGAPSLVKAQRAQSNVSVVLHRSSLVTPAPRGNAPAKTSLSPDSLPAVKLFVSHGSTDLDKERVARNGAGEQDQEPSFAPIQITKTPFASETRVPVAHIWGARLQLNFSVTTVRNASVMLGPMPSSQTLHAPPQSRSADLYGFGVSIPLGRDAQVEGSKSLWRSFARLTHSN
jgi:hypothetical protein